jgi:hypothetical protein
MASPLELDLKEIDLKDISFNSFGDNFMICIYDIYI